MFAVVRDLYYDTTAIEELVRIAARIQSGNGRVRAAEFRDATGLGRKRAIQILEFFDRIGHTRRVRDDHIVRPTSPLTGGGAHSEHAEH